MTIRPQWARMSPILLGVLAGLVLMTPVSIPGAENAAEAYGPELAELPDWTGVWNITGGLIFPGPEFAVYEEDPAGDDGGFSYGPLPGSYFTGAPYNEQYQGIYDERTRRAREEFIVADPVGGCMLPHGMPRMMGGAPGPTEIIVTPKQTWIIWDYMNELRRIYTDGRPHPPEEEAWPSVMGHSIGHWEGHTLVVDTVNMMEGIFDRTEAPHSDRVHLMERITKIDNDTLEIQMTIEDPVALTRPWQVTRYFRKIEDQQINIEGYYCDNQRNPIIDGNQSATLPGD